MSKLEPAYDGPFLINRKISESNVLDRKGKASAS